jgi:2-dehydropantoate 2-reductase
MSGRPSLSEGATDRSSALFFGVGSVGAVYMYLLSRICDTTAVCRSNYDIVKERGFTINSSIFGQNLNFKPNVVRTCKEAAAQQSAPFDYLVITSKVTQNTIPETIRPAVTPRHTVIVLIQNGIGIEEEYAAAFPENPIVSAAVYCKTTQRPPGTVAHDEVERLDIGAYPSSALSDHAQAFTKLMTSAGSNSTFYPDVQRSRWYKLLVNAAWNPICALTLSTDADFMTSSAEAVQFALDVMLEVRDIAQAYGHEISKEEVEQQIQRAKLRIERGNGAEPSMLQDVKEGRRMEVEAILGNTVRMGTEKNVACTRLQALYLLARALDAHLGRKRE